MNDTVLLIPAYKPDMKLLSLIDEVQQNTDYDIVVVNDGSGHDFDEIFAALPDDVFLVSYDVNRGKGSALKTGFAYIEDNLENAGYIVTADADGQHKPKDIIKTVEVCRAHPNSLTLGSRKFVGDVPFKSKAGNTLTRWSFKLATGVTVYDTQTGLRALGRSLLPMLISTSGERYEYELNMLLGCAGAKIPIVENEIETVYIDENKSSHFNVLRDSARIYACLLKFCASSLLSFLIDFILLFVFKAVYMHFTDAADETVLLFAVATSRIISASFNFIFNRRVVFRSGTNLGKSLAQYAALALFILAGNYGLLYLLNILLKIPLFISKLITEVGLFLVSYTVQKSIIFKKS